MEYAMPNPKQSEHSNLPINEDIIIFHIIPKLDPISFFSFRAVCSSWRTMAKNNPPSTNALLLMMTHNPAKDARHLILGLHSFDHRFRCIGCWGSWIAIEKTKHDDLYLFDMITKSSVRLPYRSDLNFEKIFLLSEPTSDECKIVSLLWYRFIKHKLGDRIWYRCNFQYFNTRRGKYPIVSNVATFFNGKLYALNYFALRLLYICDVSTEEVSVLVLEHEYHDIEKKDEKYMFSTPEEELMLVLQYRDQMTTGFKVAKLDEKKLAWVTMENLNGRALIVSDACSLCFHPNKECPELEGNCIYFVEGDNVEAKVFRMSDGSIRSIGDGEKFPLCLFLFHQRSLF